jgi:hypothetical protein
VTGQVDTVPRLLSQLSSAAAVLRSAHTEPPPTITTATQWVPSDRHGRIPCIGLDSGAMPNTRPDHVIGNSRWGVA